MSAQDVCYSMKPLKMGLRVCSLMESWDVFTAHYDRVTRTCELLYQLKLTDEEREKDLEDFKKLREILKKHKLVKDTVLLINQEIKNGKRILVEDCSST